LSEVAIDDAEVASLYERKLALVRPDGHVAWRGDAFPFQPERMLDQVAGWI
jgi:hypothetical protein